MSILPNTQKFIVKDNYDLIRSFVSDSIAINFFVSGDNFVKEDSQITSFDFDGESEKIIQDILSIAVFPHNFGFEYAKGKGFIEVDFNNQKWFFQIMLTDQDAIKENIRIWDEKISWLAKTGMREYTEDELWIYNQLVESNNKIIERNSSLHHLKGKAPWDTLPPVKHKSISALKPFDSKSDDNEVWGIVHERIIKNEYDANDEDYMKEIEKRTNGETSLVKIREKNKSLVEKYESLKKEKVGIELKTENE
jgi:hypothetical protein